MVLFSCYAEAAPSRTPTSIQGHFYTGSMLEWTMEVALQPNGVADGYIRMVRNPETHPIISVLLWDVYAWATDGNSITLVATQADSDSIFVISIPKSKEFLRDGFVCPITHGGYSISYSR